MIGNKTLEQIEECCQHHFTIHLNKQPTEELLKMCRGCEEWYAEEHNYDECRHKPCFKFWLAYEYLRWKNSFE